MGNKKSPSVLAHGRTLSSCLDDNSIYSTPHYSSIELDLQDEVDSKFLPKKKHALLLADVYNRLGMDGRMCRVADCGSYLEYHVTDDAKMLHTANFCKDRLCPMCNWRRSLKIFGQVSQVMDVLEGQQYRFLFLTLTVRNCSADDLPATVQVLYDGWRMLYNKKSIFKKSVEGTFRSLEVTRNAKTGTFHPHLHVILAVRLDYFRCGYIPQSEWAKLWRSCCDLDYDPIVDIRTILPNERGLSGAVAEVSKYAVKASDFLRGSMDDMASYVWTFLTALSGRRLCSFTGVFAKVRKQLALDDIESGDLIHVDGSDLRDDVAYMIVRYRWAAGFYERSVELPSD